MLPGPVSPDCCRGPGRIFGMVSAAPLARAGKGMRTVGRSSRLAVVRSSRRRAAVASLGGPLRPSGRGPELGSSDGRDFLRPIPFRTFRSACASHRADPASPAGRSFAPGSRRLRTLFREPGFRPLSVSSFCLEPCLRIAVRLSLRAALARRLSTIVSPAACASRSTPASHRTCVPHSASGRAVPCRPSKLPQRVGGASASKLPGLSHPRTVPNAVSRRHLHRFQPV